MNFLPTTTAPDAYRRRLRVLLESVDEWAALLTFYPCLLTGCSVGLYHHANMQCSYSEEFDHPRCRPHSIPPKAASTGNMFRPRTIRKCKAPISLCRLDCAREFPKHSFHFPSTVEATTARCSSSSCPRQSRRFSISKTCENDGLAWSETVRHGYQGNPITRTRTRGIAKTPINNAIPKPSCPYIMSQRSRKLETHARLDSLYHMRTQTVSRRNGKRMFEAATQRLPPYPTEKVQSLIGFILSLAFHRREKSQMYLLS